MGLSLLVIAVGERRGSPGGTRPRRNPAASTTHHRAMTTDDVSRERKRTQHPLTTMGKPRTRRLDVNVLNEAQGGAFRNPCSEYPLRSTIIESRDGRERLRKSFRATVRARSPP